MLGLELQANDLGLTTAVPARIEVLVDARLKPIKLGKQEIRFKCAAPSHLYWAGHPAMRVVQALHWMQGMLAQGSERQRVQDVLTRMLADTRHGQAIRDDLRALPIWVQEFLRGLLNPAGTDEASQWAPLPADKSALRHHATASLYSSRPPTVSAHRSATLKKTSGAAGP